MPRTDGDLIQLLVHSNNEMGYYTDVAFPGQPPVKAGKFAVGCRLVDSQTGDLYVNSGSIEFPAWDLVSNKSKEVVSDDFSKEKDAEVAYKDNLSFGQRDNFAKQRESIDRQEKDLVSQESGVAFASGAQLSAEEVALNEAAAKKASEKETKSKK